MITVRGMGSPALTTWGWGTFGVVVEWPLEPLNIDPDGTAALLVGDDGGALLQLDPDATAVLLQDAVTHAALTIGGDATVTVRVSMEPNPRNLELGLEMTAVLHLAADGSAIVTLPQEAAAELAEGDEAQVELEEGPDASLDLSLVDPED